MTTTSGGARFDAIPSTRNRVPQSAIWIAFAVVWIWLDVALCAARAGGAHDRVPGLLAACRYFYRYELPRVPAWLRVVETRDDIHYAANLGDEPVVLFTSTLLRKGAPLATPVPP